ncbi:MAG: Holliday junction branch migration protein RuvA [Chloroflexi bacterium]|nr:Holliday junction branch migration protein RuvA [Chloroflexota bacterium]MBT4074424.1 Holliday junction branch migration protein RuvA [Chloroflexota bacterium]MBT4514666.1 Holliday junction branch migration protein RuvA [Chloroflexota bacterium]MBT5319978.1 Holliday junction branch migration protein RuvA [Chloroflexota bacterium]MBT6680910.1 Holliday junction branch migration protein RuvA [Chloroflexota bacterium]
MISYIEGKVHRFDRSEEIVVINAGGVGYQIVVPKFVMSALSARPTNVGDELGLETYYHVTDRQPKPVLVGFQRPHERAFFEQLIQVEGLGPVRAAKAMIFSVSTIAQAIEAEDLRVLQRMPGIGARAAQKIVATLKGKVVETAMLRDEGYDDAPAKVAVGAGTGRDEAVEVLVNLGYRQPEAERDVDEAIMANPELATAPEELIREIFKAQAVAG